MLGCAIDAQPFEQFYSGNGRQVENVTAILLYQYGQDGGSRAQ
jgi:hypothetical protein